MNAVMVGLLVWVARGVRRGRRFGAALGVLSFLLFSVLFIAALVGVRGGYIGTATLAVIQGLFVLVLLTSLVLVLLAWIKGGPERDPDP
jgi:hypothetical protein